MSVLLPRMFPVRQHFDANVESDPISKVGAELDRIGTRSRIGQGQTVSIAVGSRGIANLSGIVGEVVRYVTQIGGRPRIIPAMGSHGGGAAEGQRDVLASLGITAERMGCPIEATMDTVVVGHTRFGLPIHFDRIALTGEHLIVVNRVKPHTMFAGNTQSGLLKMLMIGLGKRNGAELYHRAARTVDFDDLIADVVPQIFAARPLTAALAIVENAFDNTALVEAVTAETILTREPELLRIATSWMPKLPFDRADLLIVDQIGKNISGSGMDTNIIGRKKYDKHAADDEFPKISEIYVRGLTPATHGNAAGIGLAEYCRSSILEELDYHATRINSITAGHVTAAAIPMHLPTDREILEIAAQQAGLRSGPLLAWLWILDTLHLEEIACSESFFEEAVQRADLTIMGEPKELEFDQGGMLVK